MENEVTITHATNAHKKICSLKEALQKNFIELGAYLKIVHDENLYLLLDYPTWQEYLDVPEVDLSRSQAFKLMAVFSKWCERWGYSSDRIKKTSIEKLYIASSQATDSNHEEWLLKAEMLSRADLKAETPGSKYRPTLITCPYCGKSFELRKEDSNL